MLVIRIDPDGAEYFDEEKYEFVHPEPKTYIFEHSLASVSKWESIWKKPFLIEKEKTREETVSYLKCMLIGGDEPDDTFETCFSNSDMEKINEYMNDSQTATWFNDKKAKNKRKQKQETITSELIYYWMISFDIPFECQYWHLNKLMTLIRVCGIKESGGEKMSKKDILKSNSQLNAARKAKQGMKG